MKLLRKVGNDLINNHKYDNTYCYQITKKLFIIFRHFNLLNKVKHIINKKSRGIMKTAISALLIFMLITPAWAGDKSLINNLICDILTYWRQM